jgi:hypothetical protein
MPPITGPGDAGPIPEEWLYRKISVEEAEAANSGIGDERVTRSPELALPFGGLSGEWESLKAAIRPGDEIWTFAAPADSGKTWPAAPASPWCGMASPSWRSSRL